MAIVDDSVMQFSLKRKEIPIQLENEEGEIVDYKITELTGKQRDSFLNLMSSRTKYAADGTPAGIKNFDGLQASLLALCLTNSEGKKATVAELAEYPASVVNELYKAAQKLNALDEQGQEEAKNE